MAWITQSSSTSKDAGTTSSILQALDAAGRGDYYVGHLNNVAMMNRPEHFETEQVVDKLTNMCCRILHQLDGVTDEQRDWATSRGEVMAMQNVLKTLSTQGAFLCGLDMTQLVRGAAFDDAADSTGMSKSHSVRCCWMMSHTFCNFSGVPMHVPPNFCTITRGRMLAVASQSPRAMNNS